MKDITAKKERKEEKQRVMRRKNSNNNDEMGDGKCTYQYSKEWNLTSNRELIRANKGESGKIGAKSSIHPN